MDLEGLADAELVDEGRHELRVGFEGDESGASLGDIWICECRHGGLVRYGCRGGGASICDRSNGDSKFNGVEAVAMDDGRFGGVQAPCPSVVGVAMTLPLQPWISRASGFRTTGFIANATKKSSIDEDFDRIDREGTRPIGST